MCYKLQLLSHFTMDFLHDNMLVIITPHCDILNHYKAHQRFSNEQFIKANELITSLKIALCSLMTQLHKSLITASYNWVRLRNQITLHQRPFRKSLHFCMV